MWNNYFFQLQKKYNMRISTKSPFVVRFDGKCVTKNKEINFFDNFEGSFSNSLYKCAKYFSKLYHCFAICGSDEISFIVLEPKLVIEDLEPNDKTTHSQELIALFSQYFFDYFNHFDLHQKIFWHGKCFSIPNGKVASYIKYRSGIIRNVLVTYFAKINNINEDLNLEDKENKCKSLYGYEEFDKIKSGILVFDGERIELDRYFKDGEICKLKEQINNCEYKDIEDVDVEILKDM